MYSMSGLKKGRNDKRYQVHQVWAKHRLKRREPVCLLENVPQYEDEHLDELLEGEYTVLSARFCPSQMGYRAARPRFYALLLEPSRASWDCDISFKEFRVARHNMEQCLSKCGNSTTQF
jgi:hypothetical protein